MTAAEDELVAAVTDLLAKALEQSGMSRKGFARRLGLSYATVTHRLLAQKNFSVRELGRMLDVLGYTVEISLRERERAPELTPISAAEIEGLLQAGRQRQTDVGYEIIQLARVEGPGASPERRANGSL